MGYMCYQVNNALTLDHTRQWVDLGIHTEACMTRPETCTSGGAISVWVKVIACNGDGIISSHSSGIASTGLVIACYDTYIPYDIHVFTDIFT